MSSIEGVVSGFVGTESLQLMTDAIIQSAVAGLASEILEFWPMPVPPLVLALFEDRASFDKRAGQFAGIAAAGSTVIIGCPGSIDDLPPMIHGIDLLKCDDLSDAWGLLVVESTFSAALIAVRSNGFRLTGDSDKGHGPIYSAKWTFRREQVREAATQLLKPLRSKLMPATLALADAAIAKMNDAPVSDAEARLLQILEVMGTALLTAPTLSSVAMVTEVVRPRVVRDI